MLSPSIEETEVKAMKAEIKAMKAMKATETLEVARTASRFGEDIGAGWSGYSL